MTFKLNGSQWRYCAKVGIAAGLGYLLTLGQYNQYAVYSAFTASLVVGTSVGEDLATSMNRVKGTIAGMASAMIITALVGPNFWSVGASVALTALIAVGFGWGVPVARIGVTIGIITLAMHGANALEYDLMRAANTAVGIVAGLAVTFFVWPVRGHDDLQRAALQVLQATAGLLDALDRGEIRPRVAEGKVHDAIAAVVKAVRDTQREQKVGQAIDVDVARVIAVMRLGMDALSAALAEQGANCVPPLRERLALLQPPVTPS
ncbi:hypothetical protein DSM104443_03213 [Usitatibacter rugosus]|uniref:Integral membrane bound transporter domain-containing protein n=1 Tax=Usitatibacter rugosus TaxID=2732067 RepID=A0A6M4GXZ5_9PROT|nr:FUSC family protein [Usitatibacter rugosus]QJR12129.1 hypothetical protein DSM104443_03213 [Usitatibacter rugosus]